jgi:p-hydroxybenzoic acid synthase
MVLSARINTFFEHAGSVTRHMQLLTGSAVSVDCLAMEPVPAGTDGLPPVVHAMLAAPLLQREVRASTEGRGSAHWLPSFSLSC